MIGELFNFKQKSQDFIVEEQLPFILKGKGDAFFVFFEKRNMNTMDVIDHLCKKLKISRMTLGIAGLKDKRAITRQWVSIYKSALKKLGGQAKFLQTLEEKVKIVSTNWHDTPIGMTTKIANIFYIRLRAKKTLSLDEKKAAQKHFTSLFDQGFINLFGEQRFGLYGRNIGQGNEILSGISDIENPKEVLFKTQAFASALFNDYAKQRMRQGNKVLDGDILEVFDPRTGIGSSLGIYLSKSKSVRLFHDHKTRAFFHHPRDFHKTLRYDPKTMRITGPVLGHDILMPPGESDALHVENTFFEKHHIGKQEQRMLMQIKLFGRRRALHIHAYNAKVRYQGDDLLMSFSLPAGSYASTIINAAGLEYNREDRKKKKRQEKRERDQKGEKKLYRTTTSTQSSGKTKNRTYRRDPKKDKGKRRKKHSE